MSTVERPPAAAAPPPAPSPEAPARARRGVRLRTLEAAGLAALALAALAAFLVYPTYANYDSLYSLLWARELVALEPLSFEAYRAPTEHPLAIAFGVVLLPLGEAADRVMVLFAVGSFVALVAALYALGKTAFTPLVGAAAAALLVTRFDFGFLAARGYIDIPYLAVVLWAAVLEARRPRRGTVVLLMLVAAGLMRPEAWLLGGLYWLWLLPRASWAQRLGWGTLVWVAPVLWATTDFLVTGNPLYSHTATSELAAELGRNKGAGAVPEALYAFLVKLVQLPVVLAGAIGFALALMTTPRRLGMPVALFAAGVGTFTAVGVAGLSVIDRYLLVPSLVVMLFAGVALAGWTMLRHGTLARRAWAGGAIVLIAFGVLFTVTRVNLNRLDSELEFRGESRAALKVLLDDPSVRAGLACGPILVPNHKLIPDVRWLLDLPESRVLARSDPDAGAPRRGVAVLVHGRQAIFKQALVSELDDPADNLPPAGFDRAATSQYYAAYVGC